MQNMPNPQNAYEAAVERYVQNRPPQVANRIPSEQLALEYRFRVNEEDFATQTKHIKKYQVKMKNYIPMILAITFFWLFVMQSFLTLVEDFSSESVQILISNLVYMLFFCGLVGLCLLIDKERKNVGIRKKFAQMKENREVDTPTKALFYGNHIEWMNAGRYKLIAGDDACVYELPDGIYILDRNSDEVFSIPARYFDADSAFQLYVFLNGDSNWKYFFKKRMQLPNRKEMVEDFTLVDTHTPQYEFNFIIDRGYVKKTESVRAIKRVFFILVGGFASVVLVGALLLLMVGDVEKIFSGTVYLIFYVCMINIVNTLVDWLFFLPQKKIFTGSVRARFFEDCFEQTEGNSIRRIPYSSVKKLRVTKQRTYLYTKDKKTYFVPQSAFFVPEKRGEFDNFLKAHVLTK